MWEGFVRFIASLFLLLLLFRRGKVFTLLRECCERFTFTKPRFDGRRKAQVACATDATVPTHEGPIVAKEKGEQRGFFFCYGKMELMLI